MQRRWLKSPRALLFMSVLFIVVLAVSCGTAAPEQPAVAEPAAPAVAPDTSAADTTAPDTAAMQEAAPTAVPAAASEAMAESNIVRIVESQGEITQETNQHCAGGRPITSNFNPYGEHPLDINPVTAEIEAWLAETWESSADARSWTFNIRQGVPFHFGYGEMTAHDLAWMAQAKGQDDCLSSTTSFWKELVEVEVVDDYTLIFHMEHPTFLLPLFVSSSTVGSEFFAFSKAQHDEVGYENMDDVKLAATGYFQYLERNLGENLVVERVPYEHWRAMPQFKEHEQQFIAEESTRLAGLLAGELHMVALSRDLQQEAVGRGMKIIPAQQAFTQLTVFFGGMYFIPGDPDFDPTTPWADLRVRRAMNKAINRDELNEFILKGQGEREHVTGVCHATLQPECYNPDWETRWDDEYGYDPEEAARLLAEAGYGPDNPIELTIINYRSRGEPESPLVVEALPQYWKPLGINATIQDLDTGAATKLWREKRMQHGLWANVFSFRPVSYRVRDNASSNSRSHYFEHEFVDQKYEELKLVKSIEESDQIGREVANFWYDQQWTMPFFWFRWNATVNPEFIEDWKFLNRGKYWHLIEVPK